MTNSRAGNTFGKIHNTLASGTAAIWTFNPTLDMKLVYREIIIIMTGKATAALGLNLTVNNVTDYDESYVNADTTTLTTVVNITQPAVLFLPASHIDGAVAFHAKISIVLDDADDQLHIHSRAAAPHEGNFTNDLIAISSGTSITELEITTTTSTWIAGTEITVYGIRR